MLVDESRIHRRQSTKNPLGRAVFVRLRALVLRSAIGFSTVSVIICGTMALGQVQPGKPVLDPAAVKSRLVVRSVKGEKGTRKVVVLGKPQGTNGVPESAPLARLDMLPRELLRQAVLIAARDELGLFTRDQVIDDTPADGDEEPDGPVEVVSMIRLNRSREEIRRLGKEKPEWLLIHGTQMAMGRNLELGKLVASAEVLSREEVPGVLKGLGLDGKPNEVKAEGGYPREVEERLGSLGYIDVLLAVREVHRAIQMAGETPERLGALVRGYALLGVLSEHEWNPAIGRSRPDLCFMRNGWSRGILNLRGGSGTARLHGHWWGATEMPWPTWLSRRKRPKHRTRPRRPSGWRSSMLSHITTPAFWRGKRDRRRSLPHSCAC